MYDSYSSLFLDFTMSSSEAPHTAPNGRRGSLSLSEYFSSSRAPTSSITTAAAQANQQRRASTSGNSPPQFSSSFGNFRRGSVSSVSSTSSAVDENAIDDADAPNVAPTSPIARRMSWGARAFREVRVPPMPAPRGPQSASAASPTVTRGFWENGTRGGPNDPALQRRRQSISTMPTPPMADLPPPKEPAHVPQPDHLQERILKGDFYMD